MNDVLWCNNLPNYHQLLQHWILEDCSRIKINSSLRSTANCTKNDSSKDRNYIYIFLFLLDFGLSWLTSLQFIQYHVAGFYKLTIPQSPPSHLRDYSTCNNARWEFSTIFCSKLWSKWMVPENGFHNGGLNPGPLGLESSALTTRPRLLANEIIFFTNDQLKIDR